MPAVTPKPDETEIVGQWKSQDGKVVADEVAQRIAELVREWFRPAGQASGGWERLLQDPSDGRFWEMTYPKGEVHGGGPPTLRVISAQTASKKYGIEI